MKNNFWFLSALLLTVHSPALGIANPSVASGSQVQVIKVPVLQTSDNALKEELTQPAALVAQASPNWPTISLTKRFSGLNQPVYITHADDDSGRLFVVERSGRIRLIKNGVLLSQPFLDITSRVNSADNERGLLSVAFPPNYQNKKYFYVYYTNLSGDIVLARYRVSTNPDLANSNSQEVVLTIAHRSFPNHNGGQLAFGPDGYLYIGTGDGGGAGDPLRNGQKTNSLLGKMLRIDVESGAIPYRIPASNPFRQTPGYRAEIWALGLRNPWRFSFDRHTGELYIGDVGQGAYEEVDVQPAGNNGGRNYGWNIMEGAHCFNTTTCDRQGLTLPVAEYKHPQGISITGGMVYRGQDYLEMYGIYFHADFVNGNIWGLKRSGTTWQKTLLIDTPFLISSFGEDQVGNLYITDYVNGDIYAIASQRSCTITGSPGNDTLRGTAGNDVICGLGGNDTIIGGDGADIIYGGEGNDTINGGSDNDVIQGSEGSDRLSGDGGSDTIYGKSGNNTLSGGNGNDFLGGGTDNDTFNGGTGTDTCLQFAGTGSKTACEK